MLPSRSTWSKRLAIAAPGAMPSPDSTMQPSMQPSPSARAACTIRTPSRIPPDFASLTLIPCARSAQRATSASRMAVLVDVDRERRAGLERRPVRIAGRQRLLAVLDAERGQLRQGVERLVEAPRLVHVHLQRHACRGGDRAHALDVEAVAAAELQLQPPEAAADLPGTRCHVVGIAEPDRPGRRRPRAAQAEELPHGDAEQLALEVVQRRVERCSCRELARGQPLHDLLERERIVAERAGVLGQVAESRLRRFLVARDRRRLAEARDAVVTDLDPDDILGVAGAARDDERLRELERLDPGRRLHAADANTRLRE